MVVLAHGELEEISLPVVHKPTNFFSDVPVIDLSEPASKARLIGACEELGFFKVTNHGIPVELLAKLEEEALRFFSLPQVEKELSASSAGSFGYGSKKIGANGDLGWVEYILLQITSKPISHSSLSFLKEPSASLFCSVLNEYITAVRKLACAVLELMAEPQNSSKECVQQIGHGFGERLDVAAQSLPSMPTPARPGLWLNWVWRTH